ncbi:hypothetical protein PAXRUDRAFT_180466, partial [Paxillus rubicundulus Ve08.2h10]
DWYRELLWVARIWRVLKLLKWNGFGHDPRVVGSGELVLLFPACPQEGVNLDPEIDKDMSRQASKLTCMVDGNICGPSSWMET